MMRSFGAIAAGIAVGLACAEGSGGAADRPEAAVTRAPEATETSSVSLADAQGGATIAGRVKFTGAKPTNPTIDMSEEPQCKEKYQTTPRMETVTVNANGTLANVFVYVKSGLPETAKYTAPATPIVLDQEGCRYKPHTMGVQVGQGIEIRNSDPLLHNIKAKPTKNRGFNISQPRAGMKTTRSFTAAEVMVGFECNVHGWMNAYVGVLPHPYFATTGSDGAFTIKGLPAGTYTVEAWHEKYGTQTATVTVAGAESKTQEFTFAAK